jgi:hypothetical protein
VLLLHLVLISLGLLALSNDPYFFFRDDYQSHCLAGFTEIVRVSTSGTFPLVTDGTWYSGALAAEYQFGVFSPVQAAVVLAVFSFGLPLHYTAALLFGVFALILATGAYVLARSYGVSPWLAVMVALAASLNGWIIIWGVNWFPAVSSFAWLPWAWWAMHRLIESPRRQLGWIAVGATFTALTVLAGFPFTVLMLLAVAGWLSLQAVVTQRRLAKGCSIVVSVGLGLALSAPAWAMLVEYKPATARSAVDELGTFQFFLSVPPQAYLGMILPSMHVEWPRFQPGTLPAAEMHVGLAPIVLLLAAFLKVPRRLLATMKLELILLGFVMGCSIMPSLGSFRWMFRWLPLVFLTLSLTAARAAELAGRNQGALTAAADGNSSSAVKPALLAILALQVILITIEGGTWLGGALLLLVGALWYAVEQCRRFLPKATVSAAPAAVVVASSVALYAALPIPFYAGQAWRFPQDVTETSVLDPSITYLSIYSHTDQFRGELPRRVKHFQSGNFHLYSGLKAVNGYSPMRPRGLQETFDFDVWSAVPSGRRTLLASGAKPGPLLRRMGVDGLVLSETMDPQITDLPLDEFVKVADLAGSTVYHRRAGKSPIVRCVPQAIVRRRGSATSGRTGDLPTLEVADDVPLAEGTASFDSAAVRVIGRKPDKLTVEVNAAKTGRHVLLSFARAWYPGYQAFFNGRSVPCSLLDGMMPAVVLPPGSQGQLLLVYRPSSLLIGLLIAGCAAACLILAFLLRGCLARNP